MKKLIVLRGNSGSGKTTIAKMLQKHFGRNTMLISQDVVRRDMLMAKDGPDNVAIPLMVQLLKYGHEHSETVIMEGIMYSQWYKPVFSLGNELYGQDVFAYYFELPFEETLRRHMTKPNRNEFGENELRRWWTDKDYSDALAEKSITQDQSADEIVAAIVDEISKREQRG